MPHLCSLIMLFKLYYITHSGRNKNREVDPETLFSFKDCFYNQPDNSLDKKSSSEVMYNYGFPKISYFIIMSFNSKISCNRGTRIPASLGWRVLNI